MTFITPSIISLQAGTNTSLFPTGGKLILSDHSRSPLSVNYEVIENFQRMADGTARKYVVSRKKNFSCSWNMLPTITTLVADSNANSFLMKSFYETYLFKPLTMTLTHHRDGVASSNISTSQETYNVFWQSFSYDVIKRYRDFDYWNVSAAFMEV